MVYLSKFPDIELFKSGVIQFLFENPFNCAEDKPIFVDALDGRTITFGEFKDLTLRFAAGLQDVCKFQENEVLGLFAPNQYDYAIPLFGTLAANGTVTLANPNYTVEELVHQLQLSKATTLICHESNIETALIAGKEVGIPKEKTFIFGNEVIQGAQPFSKVFLGERRIVLKDMSYEEAKEKVAFLCFSSGTTGKSKGVMTTHANMTANVPQWSSADLPFIDPNKDSILAALPFFHVFGLAVVLHTAIHWGMTAYILPRFTLPTFCNAIQKYKVSYIPVAPPMLVQLSKEDIVSDYDLSSFRIAICGAAPLSATLTKAVKDRLPNLTIKQGYGMTEASPGVSVERVGSTIDGSIGNLVPNMMAKIVDENGNEVKEGEPGELWVKGPNIMKGYIGNPEATAECIDKDGFYHTGDVAIMDKNGYLYIVDRLKELIKYNGFQVPPAELEGILLRSPIIADCAVIGIYDSKLATELPCACIVLKKNVERSEKTSQEIMKFVASQVTSYKQIRIVRYYNEIPKNASGKILRRILRDSIAAEEKAKLNPSSL